MKASIPEVHIAIAFDQNFIVPLYVLLTSIFRNSLTTNIVIHAIATGVNEDDKCEIREFVLVHKAVLFYYEIDVVLLSQIAVIPENSSYTPATYVRLFFPDLVSSTLNKLIYIDTDVVVHGDLYELYSINLDGFTVAASTDMGVCGLYEVGSYFNAGVLLIDIERWRVEGITRKAIKYLYDYPEKIRFADQDALNIALRGKWLKIDNRFNLCFNDIPRYLPKNKYKTFLKNIVIIHFTGSNKPWLLNCSNKFRHVYLDYIKCLPMNIQCRQTHDKLSIKKVLTLFKVNIFEFFCNYPTVVEVYKKIRL